MVQLQRRWVTVSFICILLFSLMNFSLIEASETQSEDELLSVSTLQAIYADASSISNWATAHIVDATEKGFVEGSNGYIYPQNEITRAEFAKLMVSVLGIALESDDAASFTDVKKSDWFYPYVNTAFKENIVSGYSDNSFQPNKEISREEMATMIVRVLGIEGEPSNTHIADLHTVSSWAQHAVKAIVAEGIMEGYDNKFNPKDVATREMAIVVSMRTYHYDPDEIDDPTDENEDELHILEKIEPIIVNTATFMQKMTPEPTLSTLGGDWSIIGLARSNAHIPSSYFEKYYTNVENEVKQLMPATDSKKEGRLDRSKGTEHSRLMLGLTAIGKNVYNVGGYDITEALADFNYVITQGINGPIFALIAFDSGPYDIPIVDGVSVQTTREKLIEFILDREIAGGGWALGANATEPDVDVTAMAIQGLTPYYEKRVDVKKAVDRAVQSLSNVQGNNGDFYSWGVPNSESAAQVIVALSGLRIDAHTDERFVKNGHSVIDSLLSFAAPTGGFYHILSGQSGNGGAQPGTVDAMATDQAMYALVAYERFLNDKNRLYDMTDL